MRNLLVLFGLSVTLLAQPAATPQKLELFLLIGQSNMAGRGKVEPQDAAPIAGIWALGKDDQWKPAVDPLHWDKPDVAGVGLGRTFAKTLQERNPGAQIGLIPAAFGGTSLEQWKVGGELYTEAIRRARVAMKNGRIRGMLWHQGEAESGKEELAKTYRARWTVIIQSMQKELGLEGVPVVVGQLGRFLVKEKQPFADLVNQEEALLPLSYPHTAFVSTEGLKDKGDSVHFDSASARELGRRYALAFLGLDAGWGK